MLNELRSNKEFTDGLKKAIEEALDEQQLTTIDELELCRKALAEKDRRIAILERIVENNDRIIENSKTIIDLQKKIISLQEMKIERLKA